MYGLLSPPTSVCLFIGSLPACRRTGWEVRCTRRYDLGMEPACRRTGWEVRCTRRLFMAISSKRRTGWEVRCLAAFILTWRRTGWEVRCLVISFSYS